MLAVLGSHPTGSIFFPILLIILFCNHRGLLPFVFPLRHHPSLGFVCSFVLFFSFFIMVCLKDFYIFISALVPAGVPLALVNFLFIVEYISYIVRPFVLFVRLSSNIFSGHLIVVILFTILGFSFSFFFGYFIFFSLEFCLGAVQAFVFFFLLKIYCESK